MRKLRPLAIGVMLILAMTACSRASSEPIPTVMGGYELPADYPAALEHSGNDAIFTATVIRHGAPEKYRVNQDFTYVFTPIEVKVMAVVKPGAQNVKAGQTVILRVAGGSTSDAATTNEVTAPPTEYQPRGIVQVFTQEPFAVAGGVHYVPNWTFGVTADGKRLQNLGHKDYSIDAGAARTMATEKAAWAGWQR